MTGQLEARPPNAPPAATIGLGVQPGTSRIVIANYVIIFGPSGSVSGVFVYQPGTTPGPGNPPIASVTAGTKDPYGNTVQPGITSYSTPASTYAQLTNAALSFVQSGSPATPPEVGGNGTDLILASGTTGALNDGCQVVIRETGGVLIEGANAVPPPLGLTVNSDIETLGAVRFVEETAPAAIAGQVLLFAGSGGQLLFVTPANFIGRIPGTTAPALGANTATAASLTALFSTAIPANDAVVGATYRATTWGYGTWGSTQQALTFAARFGASASTVAGSEPIIAATALAASAAFQWRCTVTAVCVTTGVTGTWRVSIEGCVTQTANAILPGTAADNSIAFAGGTAATDYTLDTTVAESLGISAAWASTTGAPTMTKIFGQLERLS